MTFTVHTKGNQKDPERWNSATVVAKLTAIESIDKKKMWLCSQLTVSNSSFIGRLFWAVAQYFNWMRTLFYDIDLEKSQALLSELQPQLIDNNQDSLLRLFKKTVLNFNTHFFHHAVPLNPDLDSILKPLPLIADTLHEMIEASKEFIEKIKIINPELTAKLLKTLEDFNNSEISENKKKEILLDFYKLNGMSEVKVIGEQEHFIPKVLLRSQSDVFESMLAEGKWIETNENIIEFKEQNSEEIEHFIRCLERRSTNKILNEKNFQTILKMALTYNVSWLIDDCQMFIASSLDKDNILSVIKELVVPHQHHLSKLFKKCIDYYKNIRIPADPSELEDDLFEGLDLLNEIAKNRTDICKNKLADLYDDLIKTQVKIPVCEDIAYRFNSEFGFLGAICGKTRHFGFACSFIPEVLEGTNVIIYQAKPLENLSPRDAALQTKALLRTKFYPFVRAVSNVGNKGKFIIKLRDNAKDLYEKYIHLVQEVMKLQNSSQTKLDPITKTEESILAVLFSLLDCELEPFFQGKLLPKILSNLELRMDMPLQEIKHFQRFFVTNFNDTLPHGENLKEAELTFCKIKTKSYQTCLWEGMEFNFWWSDELVYIIETYLMHRFSKYIDKIKFRTGSLDSETFRLILK